MEIRRSNYLVQTTGTHVYWHFIADPFSQPRFFGQMERHEWLDIVASPPSENAPRRGGNLVFAATENGVALNVATADDPPVLTPVIAIPAADWATLLADLQFPEPVEE